MQNEKRQGENQPYGVTEELITENTYPAGHPYSWTVIGSMDDLNAASMEDVKDWFKTYYGPSNAVLVLAGDIDAKTAKEKVEKYFGDIPAGPPVAQHGSLGRQDDRHASRHGAGPRAAGPHLQGLERSAVWHRRRRYLDLVSDCFGAGQEFAAL